MQLKAILLLLLLFYLYAQVYQAY